METRRIINALPLVVKKAAYRIYWKWINPFQGSERYWRERYDLGGNSGYGSFNKLAEFKAEVVNGFIRERKITSIVEYGCGDGNQLALGQYPQYIGFDISPTAISLCRKRFADDRTKAFKLMHEYSGERAELTLSLDVIYHLVEHDVFTEYMHRLFDSSDKFVIIYSSDFDKEPEDTAPHIRHRRFTRWVEDNKPEWELIRHIPNRYPLSVYPNDGSQADFYIYSKRESCPGDSIRRGTDDRTPAR